MIEYTPKLLAALQAATTAGLAKFQVEDEDEYSREEPTEEPEE